MNIAVICFTEHGAVLAERLSKEFSEREMTCRAWIKKKETQIPDCRNVQVLTQSLREWTKEQFAAVDAMIFIGATGIAVRSIAPYVRSKKTDPAVIVVDEQGRHAISLLSGHIGGANALTLLVSEWIGDHDGHRSSWKICGGCICSQKGSLHRFHATGKGDRCSVGGR